MGHDFMTQPYDDPEPRVQGKRTVPGIWSHEDLRKYLAQAADQLASELASQQANYMVPAGDVLELLAAVAAVQGQSPWQTWESWALRHVFPVHRLVEIAGLRALSEADRVVMAKRLRDLLGYCVLGLVLCESKQHG